MALKVGQILMDVAYALIEPVVDTTLAIASSTGDATIVVNSLKNISIGMQLMVVDGDNTEIRTVQSTSTVIPVGGGNPILFVNLTAALSYAHNGSQVQSPAFGTVETTTKTLFTLAEILQYFSEVQNDFLLKVRPIFTTQPLTIDQSDKSVAQPSDAIRVERIVIDGNSLRQTSQRSLDLENPNWTADRGTPRRFYQDEIGDQKIGFWKIPDTGYTATAWYSQRAPSAVVLGDAVMVPLVCSHYLKYGVLAKAWNKEGEQRDQSRANYCQKRYELGIKVTQLFMDGIGIPIAQGRGNAGFNPMVVGG